MIFHELNRGKCKTYLIGCEATGKVLLVDPLREKVERYLGFLAYHKLHLDGVLDTHTHADHRTGTFDLKELTETKVIMHRQAPAPYVDIHVEDGDTLLAGDVTVKILYTPGHTPDGISLFVPGPSLDRRHSSHPRDGKDRLRGWRSRRTV